MVCSFLKKPIWHLSVCLQELSDGDTTAILHISTAIFTLNQPISVFIIAGSVLTTNRKVILNAGNTAMKRCLTLRSVLIIRLLLKFISSVVYILLTIFIIEHRLLKKLKSNALL